MPDKPEIRNIQKIIDYFAWQCPGCLTIVESRREPQQKGEWLCDDCQRQDYEERQKTIKQLIGKRMSKWLGYTVIGIDPLFDDDWHFSYAEFPEHAMDDTRIHSVTLARDGIKWKMMADELGIFFCLVKDSDEPS